MPKRLFFAMLLPGLLFGCATRQEPEPMPELTQPVYEEPEPQENPGSLYTPNSAEFLYDDNRAKTVGDIVQVVVSEVSNAEHKSETTTDRESNINFGISAVTPVTNVVAGLLDATKMGEGASVVSNNTNDFEGTGETTQESTFEATVAARVVRMLPGRVMQVEGARRIRVNNETQILVVRGLVRQRDIAADNTVSSTALAEAQIEVYGEGVLADKQRPGWMTRVLDNIWPF
ncbi:MAG: flagellar basal body L-ring protein FlgH [Desulfovibrionaceae bacterium]